LSAVEEIASPPPPLRGEILKLDDIDTGFSANNPKRNRPYVVVNTAGMLVRVVPQSTNMERGVLVPDGVIDRLEEGCFAPYAANVRLSIALQGEPMGLLPEPYLAAVIAQAYL
jgi:hypothetical protein